MSFLRYRVIHAYINKTALEFINVGVMVYDDRRFAYRLMDDGLIGRLHCNIYKKESIKSLVQYLSGVFSGITSANEIEKLHLYFDDFSFSNEFLTKTIYDINEEIASLFRQYVTYKFEEHEERRSIYDMIKEKSIEVAQRDFRGVIDIDAQSSRVFDMLVRVKRKDTSTLYPTIIGSLENTSDINRAVKAKIYENPSRAIFGYLYDIRDRKGQNAKNVVSDIGYLVEDFTDEEGIRKSFKSLLS